MKTPFSRYEAKNAASTSSREKPHVVCVRSLVPNEKNPATSAIRNAVSATRGSSAATAASSSSRTLQVGEEREVVRVDLAQFVPGVEVTLDCQRDARHDDATQ